MRLLKPISFSTTEILLLYTGSNGGAIIKYLILETYPSEYVLLINANIKYFHY